MRITKFVAVAILAGAVTLPAFADFNVGGQARSIAMGGAGLASTSGSAAAATANPAALGMMPTRLHLELPSVNFQTTGASLSEITSWANDIWNLTGSQGIDLARQFGRKDTMLDVNANAGLSGSPASVMVEGEARVRITPNAAFREFALTGNLPADPTQMQAVVWAEAAVAIPSVAMGFKVPKFATGKGDLWLGGRLRYVRGEYVRRTISWSGSADPNDPLQTSNESVADSSGVGGDLGLIYRAPGPKDLSFGLAVTNFLKPSLGSIRQDSIWNMGMAVRPNSKTLVVADLVNINQAYDEKARLRLGVEVTPIRAIALRAGYSGDAFTSGFGVFGMDFAFSSKSPLSLSRTIRF